MITNVLLKQNSLFIIIPIIYFFTLTCQHKININIILLTLFVTMSLRMS